MDIEHHIAVRLLERSKNASRFSVRDQHNEIDGQPFIPRVEHLRTELLGTVASFLIRGGMRLVRCAVAAAVCCAAVGCSNPPSSSHRASVPAWHATFVQDRPDAYTPNAQVTLRNNTSRRVLVRGVRMSWPGYAEGDWQPADMWRECRDDHGRWECAGWQSDQMPFDAGASHRIDIRLLGPACQEAPTDRPTVELLFRDESTTSAPLDEPGARALRQVWAWQCEEQRLLEAVDIRLAAWHRARHAGEPALRGAIAVRRGTTDARVVLSETRGSVLLDFERVGEDGVLMESAQRSGRLPFLVVSSGRCDPHSVGQSTQTYTFRLWVSLDGRPPQSLVVHPAPRVRRQMDRLIYQTCDLATLESG